MIQIKFKEENGLIYYTEDNKKWKMAGRKSHPLTQKYIKLLKSGNENICICNDCIEDDPMDKVIELNKGY